MQHHHNRFRDLSDQGIPANPLQKGYQILIAGKNFIQNNFPILVIGLKPVRRPLDPTRLNEIVQLSTGLKLTRPQIHNPIRTRQKIRFKSTS